MNAELRHEPGNDAEEADVVEVTALHEVVEPIGAERRPVFMHVDDERPLARLEICLEPCGSLLGEPRRIAQLGELVRLARGRERGRKDDSRRDADQTKSHVISSGRTTVLRYKYRVPSPATTDSPPTRTLVMSPLLTPIAMFT